MVEMRARTSQYVGHIRLHAKSALLPSILIYTLGALGAVCMSSTTVYLIEQSLCRTHYATLQPETIQPGGLVDEELCKVADIQSRVASIHGTYKVLVFIPALIFTGPWGRIAETLGKRWVLFLNLGSATLGGLWFTGVCFFQFPITLIYITPLFDIIGGGGVIMSSFVYGYIAESVPADRFRILYKLSAAQLGIAFIGMTLSSWLLRSNVWIMSTLSFISMGLCIPFTLLFPDSTREIIPTVVCGPLTRVEETVLDVADAISAVKTCTDTLAYSRDPDLHEVCERTSLLQGQNEPGAMDNLIASTRPCLSNLDSHERASVVNTIFHALISQYAHSFTIFYDLSRSSTFSQTALLTYFLIVLSLSINVIFVQWASVTYGWVIAEVNGITSIEMIVSGAVLLALPFVAHKYLFTRFNGQSSKVDIFITKMSIVLHAIGVLGQGFAPNKIAYIAATTLWTIGIGWNDSLRSFVTGMIVEKQELDKLYLGIGLIETCAAMIGTAGWSAAYAELMDADWLVRRLLFIVASGILMASLIGVIRLGRIARMNGSSADHV